MTTTHSMDSTIATMQAQIIEHAQANPDFKAKLLADPKAVIEASYKVTLPAGTKIRAIQADQHEVVIVIPHAFETGKDGEMSDADLEAVAGGSKAQATAVFTEIGKGSATPFVALGSVIAGGAVGVGTWNEKKGSDQVHSCLNVVK